MAFKARQGGEAASEAAKKAGGTQFARTNWLSLEDGEKVVVRYLTDQPDWYFCDMHAAVPTKAKPKDYDGNWPSSMPAVCRYEPAFDGEHPDCFVCDNGLTNSYGRKIGKSVRDWAIAALREEVVGTQAMADEGAIEEHQVGKRVGYKDQTREVTFKDKDDKEQTRTEIALVVVNMAPSNYFDGLGSLAVNYKAEGMPGICDRDMIVRREGEGKDTKYYHTPLDPTPNLGPGKDKWKRYTDAIEEQGLDLPSLIQDRASDDFYARFFDPSKTPSDSGSKGSGGGSKSDSKGAESAPEKDSGEPDSDRLAEMRSRLREKSGAAMADVD